MGYNDLTLRYHDEIKAVLGLNFFKQASIEEDMKRNTDFTLMETERGRYACRVRSYEYYKRYKNEFTIRARTKFNQKTEIDKILEGWGDYFFYAFESENQNSILAYTVSDLDVFRKTYKYALADGNKIGTYKDNHDGTGFLAFRWSNFPAEFVIDRRDYNDKQELLFRFGT